MDRFAAAVATLTDVIIHLEYSSESELSAVGWGSVIFVAPRRRKRDRVMVRNAKSVAVEVLDRITSLPESYDQGEWYSVLHPDDEFVTEEFVAPSDIEDWEACGTKACVAGHAAQVYANDRGVHVSPSDIEFVACTALGIDSDSRAAGWLFSSYRSKDEVEAALRLIAHSGGFDDSDINRVRDFDEASI